MEENVTKSRGLPAEGTTVLFTIPELWAFARALTRNPTEADDLVQETLTRAIANIDKFTPGAQMRAWLFTIMRNTFYSLRRKAARETTGGGDCVASLPSVPASQEWTVAYNEVVRALDSLPPHYRETLILVTMLGESYESTARILDCSIGTIKSRVSRGREALINLLGGDRGA